MKSIIFDIILTLLLILQIIEYIKSNSPIIPKPIFLFVLVIALLVSLFLLTIKDINNYIQNEKNKK